MTTFTVKSCKSFPTSPVVSRTFGTLLEADKYLVSIKGGVDFVAVTRDEKRDPEGTDHILGHAGRIF